MTLEDLIKTDATNIAAQDFDEVVEFYPDGAAAAKLTPSPTAIVIRSEPGMIDGGGRVHDATVLLPRSAITGTPSTSDEMDVVLRIGEPAQHVRVSHVDAGDPGFWQLEVRR